LAVVYVDSELASSEVLARLGSSVHRCWVIWNLHKRLDPNRSCRDL